MARARGTASNKSSRRAIWSPCRLKSRSACEGVTKNRSLRWREADGRRDPLAPSLRRPIRHRHRPAHTMRRVLAPVNDGRAFFRATCPASPWRRLLHRRRRSWISPKAVSDQPYSTIVREVGVAPLDEYAQSVSEASEIHDVEQKPEPPCGV